MWILSQFESVLALPVLGAALKPLLLVVLLLLFRRALNLAVRAIARRLAGQVLDLDRRRRLDTLLRAGEATATMVVVMIVLITALDLFGLNIGPLLAGAGVVGLAISLGATTMIQDHIGGLIILTEDQFRAGDVVEIGAPRARWCA